jgi:hypothetical protein
LESVIKGPQPWCAAGSSACLKKCPNGIAVGILRDVNGSGLLGDSLRMNRPFMVLYSLNSYGIAVLAMIRSGDDPET